MPIDMSLAAKAPPRKSTPRAATVAKSTPPEPQSSVDRRAEGLNGLGQLGQGLCLMTRQYADAANFGRNFPPIAVEVAKLSEQHESVARVVDILIEIGPYGALITAAIPFVMQALANHRIIDAAGMAGNGVVPPEVLDAQMKARMAQMQAEALRQQHIAIEEAKRAQAEYEKLMENEDAA